MELFKLLGTIAVENSDANKAIDDTTDKAEQSSNKMVGAFKKVGAAIVAAFAIDKIKDFGVALVTASAEVAAEEAAFTQIMGNYSNQASEKINKIAEATGMVNSRLTPYMTSMTAKFKGLGYDIDEATDLASTGLNIAADAAAFWDKSLEDSMSALNSFVNGNYEGGEAIGLFANETTLATWASENLSLTWKDLTEKEKQFARLEFAKAMQAASGATGQASKEAGAYANVQGNLNEAWRQFKAQVGEPILQNIVIPAMKWLGDFITNTLSPAYQDLTNKIKENKDQLIEAATTIGQVTGVMLGLVGAWKAGQIITQFSAWVKATNIVLQEYNLAVATSQVGTKLLTGMLKAQEVIWGLMTGKITLTTAATWLMTAAQNALNTAIKSNPWGLILSIIALVVAALFAAYQKSETFRNAVNALWEQIKNAFMPTIQQLAPKLQELGSKFSEISNKLMASLIPVFEALIPIISLIGDLITSAIEIVMSLVIPILDALTPIIMTLTDIIAEVSETIANLLIPIFEAIAPVISVIIKILGTIVSTMSTILIPIVKLVASVISANISRIVPIIELLAKVFTVVFGKIEKVVTPIINIIGKIATAISKAVDAVSSGVGKIKGMFNFKWNLPKLKVPKFSISPAGWKVGDLLKGVKPKLSVKWNAEGAIFNKPTIFDTAYGYQGVGDDGAEAVAPIDKLQGYVSEAVKSETSGMNETMNAILDILQSYFPPILNNSKKQIVLNNGVLVGELTPSIDEKLGHIYEGKGRGR